jgi:hypothetical protein
LGLEIHAAERLVQFENPTLPTFLNELRIEGLAVNDAKVDLLVTRRNQAVAVDVLRKEGAVEIQTRA